MLVERPLRQVELGLGDARFSSASLTWASATFSSPSALATSSAETMPGFRSLSRMLRATTEAATSFCASAFSSGPMLSACSWFFVTVSSAISWCKTPIMPSFLTGMPI